MADYNIYIRNVGGSGTTNANPTNPWRESVSTETAAQIPSFMGEVSQGVQLAMHPGQAVSYGVGAVGKSIPQVAVAAAIIAAVTKTVDKGITFYNDIHSQITGEYGNKIRYDNFKANLGAIFNPVNMTINEWKAQIGYTIENQKRSQQRELLGDSIINSYSGRGI